MNTPQPRTFTNTPGKRLSPIERAKLKPTSLSAAYRAYLWDSLQLDDNQRSGEDRRALVAEYRARLAARKGQRLRALVNATCRACVGDHSEDGDPGTWQRRTDRCRCTECPLHALRRRSKGKAAFAAPEKAPN